MTDHDGKVQQVFAGWSQSYDRPDLQQWFYKPLQDVLMQRVRRLPAPLHTVLDAGVGTGEFIPALETAFARVLGLDPSMDMLRRSAGKRAVSSHVLRATAEHIPLRTESVDVVVSCMSMHWWQDIAGGWKELARVLRPGGTVLTVLPSSSLLSLPVVRQASSAPGVVVRWLSPKEHGKLARDGGFRTHLPLELRAWAWLLEATKPA